MADYLQLILSLTLIKAPKVSCLFTFQSCVNGGNVDVCCSTAQSSGGGAASNLPVRQQQQQSQQQTIPEPAPPVVRNEPK